MRRTPGKPSTTHLRVSVAFARYIVLRSTREKVTIIELCDRLIPILRQRDKKVKP